MGFENVYTSKLSALCILLILRKYSDYNHPIIYEEIIKILLDEYQMSVDKKTIGRNIKYLTDAGYNIQKSSNNRGCYLLPDHDGFSDAELHLLIDSVLYNKMISKRQTKDLIDKLCNLTSKYFKSNVRYVVSVDDMGKRTSSDLFWNIEQIDEAIRKKCRISYDYSKFGIDKKLHKTSEQVVSPYQMVVKNQRYYLMCKNERWTDVAYHRLDHISNIKILEEKLTPIRSLPGYENGINLKDLAYAFPYMFSDTPTTVTFFADESIIDSILDWFGNDTQFYKTKEEGKIQVRVKASPSAMQYWATQFVDHVEVTFPKSLRDKIKASLEAGALKYK